MIAAWLWLRARPWFGWIVASVAIAVTFALEAFKRKPASKLEPIIVDFEKAAKAEGHAEAHEQMAQQLGEAADTAERKLTAEPKIEVTGVSNEEMARKLTDLGL